VENLTKYALVIILQPSGDIVYYISVRAHCIDQNLQLQFPCKQYFLHCSAIIRLNVMYA